MAREDLLRRAVTEWYAMMALIEDDVELVEQFEKWNKANDAWWHDKLDEAWS